MTNHQEAIDIHRQEQELEDDIVGWCHHGDDDMQCMAEVTDPDDCCENCGQLFCEQHGDRNSRIGRGEYVSTCETCYYEYFAPAMAAYRRATGLAPRRY